jgi:hypothetical protein
MAHARLHGHPTSVSDGLRAANSRAGRLLPWAIVTGTVNWILQAIEERAGIVGNIVASLIGAAWSIVTFLAVPVIVFEDVGPIDAVKRSGTLLKRTWGENIIGQAGIGIVGIVVFLPLIAIAALGAMSGVTVVVIATIAFAVLAGLVAAVVLSTLSGIFRAALYSFAVDGTVPQAFAGADIEHAFGPRKGAGRISR